MPFVSFDPDPTNPGVGWATDDQGRQVNVAVTDMPSLSTLPPSSTNMSAAAPLMSPAPAAPPEPMVATEQPATAPPPAKAPMAPASTAVEVLGKLDKVPRSGLVASGSSTTTQLGRAPGAVAADTASVNQSTDQLAGGVTQLGNQRADRAGQQAQRGAGQAAQGFYDARADQAAAEAELKANHEQRLKLDTTPDPQVDPDRYIKSLSTGKDIGLIVLAALNGAFHGAVGQQGNDVVDIIDKKIDQDIAIQKDQVAAGRADKKNKIAELMNRGYDLESAAKLAKVQAREYTAKFYEQEAAGAASQEFKDQAALDVAKIRAAGASEIRQLAQSGEARTQTTNTFARPAAPAAGAGADALKKALELDKTLEERGYSKEARSAALGALGLPPPGGESSTERNNRQEDAKLAEAAKSGKKFTEDEGKAVSALKSISDIAAGNDLARDPTTGKWAPKPGAMVTPAIKERVKSGLTLGFGDKPIESTFESAGQAYGHFLAGARIQPEDLQPYMDLLGHSAKTPQQLADRLNAAETNVSGRLPPEARGKGGSAAEAGFKPVTP